MLGLGLGLTLGAGGAASVASDTTPDAFTFTDITSAFGDTVYTSNTITVTGINAAAAITITGGTYSINGGAYTASAGTVVVNDTVAVRVTSSALGSTAVNAVLTIGGVSDTYTVTTAAAVVVNIGQAAQANGVNNTLVITTTKAAPAGCYIIVATGSETSTLSSISDGANTYNVQANVTSGAHRFYVYAAQPASDLASGSTITITYSASTAPREAVVCYVTAPTGGQAGASYTTATSTTPSLTTGTLTQATTMVFGWVRVMSGGADSLTSEGTGFTSLTGATLGTTNPYLRWAYKKTAATTAVTYDPVLGQSRTWYGMSFVVWTS